jgi:hypothetical protein
LDNEKITLPNNWKAVKLYENDNYLIVGSTDFVNSDIISNMHHLDGEKISVTKHNWVVDYTYFVNLKFYKDNEECLSINTVNGKIDYDNKKIICDKNNCEKLYSLTHKSYYENKNSCSYTIYLNNLNRLQLIVDNYWDDLNSIGLYLYDRENINNYKGELIKHDIENCLELSK